jgi:hypothetical protein
VTAREGEFRDAMVFERDLAAAIEAHRSGKRRAKGRDVYCEDGVIERGDRKVSKDGSVRFAGATWRSERLVPLAGACVAVTAEDVFLCGVDVWTEYPGGKLLVRIQRVLPVREQLDEVEP